MLNLGLSIKWSHRLAVRTPASHAGNRGSIPRGITSKLKGYKQNRKPSSMPENQIPTLFPTFSPYFDENRGMLT